MKIKRLDLPDTQVDAVFKVPLNRMTRGTDVVYPAQVNMGGKIKDRRFRTLMGDRPETKAWLVMRYADMAPNTSLAMPQKGDVITSLYVGTPAEQVVDYLVEEVRPESPLNGAPLLFYVEFNRDRERV